MPQFVIHIYFFIEFCCSYCNLSHPTSHVTHWSRDHVICKRNPILARCDLSGVDHNHRVTWIIYHVITLHSQKGASPVSQCQWPLNLVGLWVRVKGPHLLFQVTCRSSDHVLSEKRHISTNARPHNSAGDIKHRKTHKSKTFFAIQKMLTFDSHRYAPL